MLIDRVTPNSPAARGGLRVGDVVMSIDGHVVDDPQALRFRIGTLPVGAKAQLGVTRQGQSRTVEVTLIAPPNDPPATPTELKGRQPFEGATVANLSPALAEELGLDGQPRGVIVVKVSQNSIARRIGLSPGDIVLKVNDAEIASVDGLRRAVERERQGGWRLSIKRGAQIMNLQVQG